MTASTRWTKRQVFAELRRAMTDPDRLGDVSVLKSELAGTRARPQVEAELGALAEPLPRIDLEALRGLPVGTLGRGYADFLQANRLHPFALSGRLPPAIVRRNIFMARYGLVHDVFHVLTGFDTSLAGEIGVWAFVAAQRYALGHWLAAIVGLFVYPVLAPRRTLAIWRNFSRGRSMGRRARPLIALPFQDLWTRPVDTLRRELRIDAAPELDRVLAGATG